jgi:perosamine synthetase
MGRDALTLAVSHLNVGPGDRVLLPVYTCQEVLKSFVSHMDVVFYDVRPDLTIDPDEIRRKLNGRRVKMMLITNYFGFLQPHRNELKAICEQHDIALIEDCAHSLLTQGSGETGDLSTYSFRKILPVPDGGGLRVNYEVKPPAPQFYPRVYSDSLSVLAIVKSMLHVRTSMLSRARITSHTGKLLPDAASQKKNGRILPLSHLARKGMAELSFPEIIERRRDEFRFWWDISSKTESLVPVFNDLPPGVCPLGFPVRVKNRASLESYARRQGIPLSVHWRLDPALGSDCRTSHELSREILTLPLYPELGPKEREVLAGIVTREWRPEHV